MRQNGSDCVIMLQMTKARRKAKVKALPVCTTGHGTHLLPGEAHWLPKPLLLSKSPLTSGILNAHRELVGKESGLTRN